ncbi:hypothetical protein BJ912DRAFT_1023504 [Pholiota molesta]|nr:hypothetical protein BJ912DRAFT_1023504 [Pholiota molesta]
MALKTRSLTQGVPPRVREPTTRKGHSKKSTSKSKNSKSHAKRKAPVTSSSSEENDSDEPSSSEAEQPVKKKAKKRAACDVDVEDLEPVDATPPEREVEIVDEDGNDIIVVSDDEDLTAHQRGEKLEETVVKKELTLDLLTIMSDRVTVKFKVGPDKHLIVLGRWCNICKNDKEFVKLSGMRKAFHKGGNSSCRTHIRQHYDLYKERCAKDSIPMNHWAIPRPIWNEMEAEKEAMRAGNTKGKLFGATLDNTSNNDTTCRTIAKVHENRDLPEWNSNELQLPYVVKMFNLH